MNWKTLKHIYRGVLIDQNKIQYNGEDKYTIISYYPNGNKYWEREYHQGQRHGKYIRWDENGNKVWEAEYHQGQLHGISRGWYENGNKVWEAEYHQGKRIK